MMSHTSLEPDDCPAYILSGGQSTRFGSDKALVSIGNQPQLLRIQQLLQRGGHATRVIADRPDRYSSLGIDCLVDVASACGPLAGLATALQHRLTTDGEGWLLLVSCDQVEWLSEWWTQLSSAIESKVRAVTFADKLLGGVTGAGTSEMTSAMTVGPDVGQASTAGTTITQPIPGLYHTQLADIVARSLTSRQLSLQSLLRQIPTVAIGSENNPRLWSFNCPGELAALLQRLMEAE